MTDRAPGRPDAPITSLTNPRVKAAVRLRDRREREATGLTIVDGAREILRALDAGARVDTAFVSPALVRSADALAVFERLRGRTATVEASAAVLAKVAFGERSDGVVAIVEPPRVGLAELRIDDAALMVVVEGVEKPGNLGAVLRSADGAGATAVIAADPLTDLFNPNTVRASLGTIFTVPVAAASTADTLAWLIANDVRPIAAIVDSAASYTETDLTGRVALVLGSEAAGLSATWRDRRVAPVSIPMAGTADSLNVSVAAAILLYEAVRQRAQADGSAPVNPAH
jgi:RNA methyltransferase, TrmH family